MTEQETSRTESLQNNLYPSITVFFPCFNESAVIESLVLNTIDVLTSLTDNFEIIIVNDGSSDNTAEIIDKLDEQYPFVRTIHHSVNSGYGAALQSGFKAASKDLVFYTDGDAQFDIKELPELLPLLNECDIVSCYRINRQDNTLRKIFAWCWTKLVNHLFHLNLRDIDCAFKLYKRKLFDEIDIKSTGALVDTEILAKAVRKGYTIKQLGVRHYPRTAGKQSGASPAVVMRAFNELFKLRKSILQDK